MKREFLRRLSSIFLFSIIIAWGFNVSSSLATTYYFSSSSGNDFNNGTSPSSPWKTIKKANSVMSSLGNGEHFILFKRGDTWSLGSAEATQLQIRVSGTSSSARFTVGDYGSGDLPKFNGNGLDVSTGYFNIGPGENYITIQNVEIYNINKAGIRNSNSGNNYDILVTGCTLRDNTNPHQFAIEFIGSATRTVDKIEISYCSMYGTGSLLAWDIIKLNDNITNVKIHHNILHSSNHNAIDSLGYNGSQMEIYSNIIYDNGAAGIYVPGAINTEIYDNDIYSAKDVGDPSYGIKVATHGNMNNGPKNVNILNNRIWDIDKADAAIWMDGCTDCNIWNNTIYSNYQTWIGGSNTRLNVKNNLNYANTNASFPLTNYGQDPKFVDPDNGDFHLQSDSPAIDQGTEVDLPYNGTAPDLGAYEYDPDPAGGPPKPPIGLRITSP